MRESRTWIAAGALAVAAVAFSCNHGAVPSSGPAPGTLSDQMATIELEAEESLDAVLTGELAAAESAPESGLSAATTTVEVTFDRTRSCPAGGEIRWEGTLRRTWNSETRTMEADFQGTRTLTDCAFVRDGLTIVVNGSSEWEAHRRKVDGRFDGLQTTRLAGSYTAVRSDGEERSCSYEILIVRDPAARTRTLEGTICGTFVRKVTTWGGGA